MTYPVSVAYATLAVDRLGAGHSSTPPSALLTAITQANAVRQVIQTLRPRFSRIVLGGHSLGSAIAVVEAATYPVLTAIASGDPTFCGILATDCGSAASYLQAEAPFYAPAAHLESYVLSGYGYALNYAPNAPNLHAAVAAWADRVVGR